MSMLHFECTFNSLTKQCVPIILIIFDNFLIFITTIIVFDTQILKLYLNILSLDSQVFVFQLILVRIISSSYSG